FDAIVEHTSVRGFGDQKIEDEMLDAADLVHPLDVPLLRRACSERHRASGDVVTEGCDRRERTGQVGPLYRDVDILRRARGSVCRHRDSSAYRVRDVRAAQGRCDRVQLVDDVHVILRLPPWSVSVPGAMLNGCWRRTSHN